MKARLRKNLPLPSTEVVFINWKTTWRNSNRANNPLENFRPRTYMYLHKLAALSSELQCCFLNEICLTLGIWNLWASQTAKVSPDYKRGRVKYFYGIPLQGQEFCWEIKVNLVIGNANVLCMWEQITEAMCYNLVVKLNVYSAFCNGLVYHINRPQENTVATELFFWRWKFVIEEIDCSVNLKYKYNSLTKHTAIKTQDK